MTGLRLFLRAHDVPVALGGIALTGILAVLFGARSMVLRYGSGAGIPYATFLPVMSASMIAASARSRLHDLDRVASRDLRALRAGLVLCLTALAAAVLALTLPSLPPPVGTAAAVRNLVGLTGVGLLGARVLGGRLAWLLPCSLVIAVVSLAGGVEDTSTLVVWLLRADGDRGAWALATVLLAAGLVAVTPVGTREQPQDVE